jgi:glycosyltransferase involved in cell wall biosynthesis
LNIALVAPLVSPIAQPFIGGAQAFIHDYSIELARRGHKVTLFAAVGTKIEPPLPEDAEVAARVIYREVPVKPGELAPADFNAPGGFRETDDNFFRQAALFQEIFLEINHSSSNFDIAHCMAYDWPVFAFSPLSKVPAVHTMHIGAIDPRINDQLRQTYQLKGRAYATTVSQACASTYDSFCPLDRVIYNAVDTRTIPFSEKSEGYLLFAGRMTPEKGPDLAIEIARRAGKKLLLAGGIYDREFYESKIAPQLVQDKNLEYLGQLRRAELFELMRQAEGVLFTSRWEEPFGLVLAESLAAGTPVLSWQRGAAPEIIEESRTGFLLPFADVAGAAEAVTRLPELSRADCRRSIEERFSWDKIVSEYEDYYRSVLVTS